MMNRHSIARRIVFYLGVSQGLVFCAANAQNGIRAGAHRVDQTLTSLAVRWEIAGDDNANSQFALSYRASGTMAWQHAAPAMRAHPHTLVNGAPLNLSYWAAAALFLRPGEYYDLQLRLTDPDGGSTVREVRHRTRSELKPPVNVQVRYVFPGDGGGSGTASDPFLGLQAAADAAVAGDFFHVAGGAYRRFRIGTGGAPGAPIVFRGPSDDSAVIDGANTDRGVVTIGTESEQSIGWVILEGLLIRNGAWGVDAQHTRDIAIIRNRILDVDFGIYNRRESDQERNQMICDNIIEGRTVWPQAGIPGERGIDLKGFGNVVCHNRVQYFGDCVSLETFSGPTYVNEVYGNDLSYCVDDGIEIDFNQSNSAVWRNRVYNARMGISVQPLLGGPAYIFRNEFFNIGDSPIKLNNGPSGLIVMHNTGVKLGNGISDGSVWQNAVFRNNLFLGTRYAFEFLTVATSGFRDLDYNGWGTTRDGSAASPRFKWDNVRYADLVALRSATDIAQHSINVRFDELINGQLPATPEAGIEPGQRDLRLVGGALAVDAGAPIGHLNGLFTMDDKPDLGAFEAGQPLPQYGPRVQMPSIFDDEFERSAPMSRLRSR